MIFALPFVKVGDTLRGFHHIRTALPNQYSTPEFAAFSAEAKKYLDYVKEIYVGTNYEPPKYPHNIWDLRNRLKQGISLFALTTAWKDGIVE